jgi:CotH kinase protein/Lamin Tail Domain/Secretion system C-terminal sorting domain
LYVAGENGRLAGDVSIDGQMYLGAGIRYKGFSSFSTNRNKNPFNIDLDYTYSDQAHEGFNKLKLSNVIQDPSFVREVLMYEISRKYMPASRANYANVYVNDTLIGLYTNVEAVNKDFLETHYGTQSNTFFKCNPENLELNGENSNLSNTPGSIIANYHPLYRLESDEVEGWQELKNLIDTLNDSPENIESTLNVDRALWMHALNYTLLNFDSYIGYAQNYYVYKDQSGRFNPILWDLNMSFASYRLSDASDNWDGFTIPEAKIIDPLAHFNSVSVQPRPLMRNLFENDTYRRMYLAHIRTIVEENIDNNLYFTRGQHFQNIIATDVVADTNKFYSDADFIANLNTTVSDLVDYPGIMDLMNARGSYLLSYPGVQGSPTISDVTVVPSVPQAGDDIHITADVNELQANVYLAYRFSEAEPFAFLAMFDDGAHEDGGAGDGVFGAEIQDIANVLDYYVYAENDSSGRFSPERAAHEFYTLKSALVPGDLVINEVMANNQFTKVDEFNQYEDWIELYNNSNYTISTNGLFLTDDEVLPLKWALPQMLIEPGKYALFWADDDVNQGVAHANFKLNNSSDALYLHNSDSSTVDSVLFSEQFAYSTFSRIPNGIGKFKETRPSYGSENVETSDAVFTDAIFVFPNPAFGELNIRVNTQETVKVALHNTDGRTIYQAFQIDFGQTTLDTKNFANGVYYLNFFIGDQTVIKKIIISNS